MIAQIDSSVETRSMLDAALEYAERGWPVLPLCWPNENSDCGCGWSHQGKDVGKAPRVSDGANGATLDQEQIRAWWAAWPDANIGINVEMAGLLVLDFDSPDAVREGRSRSGGAGLPPAAIVRSGRGEGWHYYYLRPNGCPIARRIKQGTSKAIDLIGEGYVIAPPSVHQSGHLYQWENSPDVVTLGDAPEWAADSLQTRSPSRDASSGLVAIEGMDGDEPPVPLSEDGLDRWYSRKVELKPDQTVDRSESLYWIGVELALAGADEPTIMGALKNRDLALGWHKFARRADQAQRYGEIAEKAIDYASIPRIDMAAVRAEMRANSAYCAYSARQSGSDGNGWEAPIPFEELALLWRD